jgi:hypothetical protein
MEAREKSAFQLVGNKGIKQEIHSGGNFLCIKGGGM